MARYGITARRAYGVSAPDVRAIAKALGTDARLALELRRTGVFEARLLATLIDDPAALRGRDMEQWVKEFENWADCDAACFNLFDRSPLAVSKAKAWSRRREELVRRAGFAVMAGLAVHDKRALDEPFLDFLQCVEAAAGDGRTLVKKSANWALRQIGKRNPRLNREALRTARRIRRQGTPSARWIAADAIRELESPKVKARLARRR